jgi:hypothetical protein
VPGFQVIKRGEFVLYGAGTLYRTVDRTLGLLTEHQGRCALLTYAFDVAHQGIWSPPAFEGKQWKRFLVGDRPPASRLLNGAARLHFGEVDERHSSSPICEELGRFQSYHAECWPYFCIRRGTQEHGA